MKHSSNHLKQSILRAAAISREGHVPSALSILDLLWVLYSQVLKYDLSDPESPNRDRFILSKGHASLGLYVVLSELQMISPSLLETFCKFDSPLGGHPDMHKVPWVEASTGSLGHGFPMAVGVALGLKIRGSSAVVYTLIGDGECNEGTIWEGALLAAHQRLNNLCCVIDYNHSTDRALGVGDLAKKFESFGWRTISIDGHDEASILQAYQALPQSETEPLAIIANTVKGKGVRSMEGNPAWHHKSPSPEELEQFIEELQ